MLSVGYRISKDQNSLLPYSYDGRVITIDPVSTGGAASTRLLDADNELCIGPDGKPLLKETPQPARAQLGRAYCDRLAAFAQARQAHDPDGRAAQSLLPCAARADQGCTARRPSPARQGGAIR